MATFLGYLNVEGVMAYSICCTPANLITDSGIKIINLKQIGLWSSENCIKGYIKNSDHMKMQRMKKIE